MLQLVPPSGPLLSPGGFYVIDGLKVNRSPFQMAPTPPALSGTVWVTIPDPRITGRHGVDEVGALV